MTLTQVWADAGFATLSHMAERHQPEAVRHAYDRGEADPPTWVRTADEQK